MLTNVLLHSTSITSLKIANLRFGYALWSEKSQSSERELRPYERSECSPADFARLSRRSRQDLRGSRWAGSRVRLLTPLALPYGVRRERRALLFAPCHP